MSSLYGGQGARGSTGLAPQGRKGPTGNIKGYDVNQLPNYTPEQMELFKSLFSQVSPESYLGRLAGGDESLFGEIEAPALRQFSELQGNLASRFSGMGGLGARRSSGFQNASSQAASSFAQDLQSRRQQLQQQAIRDLFGMSQDLLGQRPYETSITPKPPSFLEQIFGGGGELFGNLAKFGKLFI